MSPVKFVLSLLDARWISVAFGLWVVVQWEIATSNRPWQIEARLAALGLLTDSSLPRSVRFAGSGTRDISVGMPATENFIQIQISFTTGTEQVKADGRRPVGWAPTTGLV